LVIIVKDLVSGCNTNAEGERLYKEILNALALSAKVEISFSQISAVTTSFVNSAFLDLLDLMTFEDIKKRIHISHSSRQINQLIKDSLTRVAANTSRAA